MGDFSIQNTHIPHAKVSTSYNLKHTKSYGYKNILTQVYVCHVFYDSKDIFV